VISVSAFMGAELVAAAVLALWVVSRYPRLGPKSVRSALAVVGAAFVVMQLSSFGVTPLLELPHGAYLTLFGCVLPSFFAGFLAAAWLMRVLAGALGGSGGGGGHRVPVPARN
jgi:nucleoside recognition membrane protein YjiH